MASGPYPSTQYFSSQFVISAGCVLFRKNGEGGLEICVVHDRETDERMLPKGRKDCGESIEAAAVRETFEETGYACSLLPLRMETRAPLPGINGPDAVHVAEGVTEPIAVGVRDLSGLGHGIKLVWWYIARLSQPDVERVHGTQTASEPFDAEWVGADQVCERLTYKNDRETVGKAIEIVRDNGCNL